MEAYIGKSIMKAIGVDDGNFINISYNPTNKKIFSIKKSENINTAYKVRKSMGSKNKESGFLKLLAKTWVTESELQEKDYHSHSIGYIITPNHEIILFADQ